MIFTYCSSATMIKKTITLFAGLLHCLLRASESLPSNVNTNDVQTIEFQSKGNCKLNCTQNYFDEGKDCHESKGRCNCIAHCCLAFDCRNWEKLVECRRKCNVVPNRFGKQNKKMDCRQYICEKAFYDNHWDSRGANDQQKNCIGHCCYAFDCRKASGYCRQACGVEHWVQHGLG